MLTNNKKTILVTGATGKQGGAAARHLMKAGFAVRGLTRDPNSKKAKLLSSLGAEMVKGNLNDIQSLDKAADGVYGIFAVTNYWESGTGKKEVIQNQNLCKVANKHAISHYILASICRCDDHPDLAHFETKNQCEKHVQSVGLPYTFLRAVYFMDNLNPNEQGASFHWAVLPTILAEKGSLQMISTDDIGWFAAHAFQHPDKFVNTTLDIAGDEVTYKQVLDAYVRVFNAEPRKSEFFRFIAMNFFKDIKRMFNWYKNPVFQTNINNLKLLNPSLKSVEDHFIAVKSELDR